jgi:hypothetical protein
LIRGILSNGARLILQAIGIPEPDKSSFTGSAGSAARIESWKVAAAKGWRMASPGPQRKEISMQSLRGFACLAVLALWPVACASSGEKDQGATGAMAKPDSNPPLLFTSGYTYELTSMEGKPVGYVFAEAGDKANRQTLRWILLNGFKSPVSEEIRVQRLAAADPSTIPSDAKGFAGFARSLFDPKTSTYVKSFAETHRILRDVSARTGKRSVIPVPWPAPRPAPKPVGELRKDTAAAAAQPDADGTSESYEQLDDGTIGIRPGIEPGGAVGPGYLDPALLPPQGIVGVAMAGPMHKSNVEYWILSGKLFQAGLENTTLGPYRVIGGATGTSAIVDWAVVVVSSSYYPNCVPANY